MYMNLENQLKEALQEKGKEVLPSSHLKIRIMNNIRTTKGTMKKRLVTGVLAVALLIPTSAFAYEYFLADEIYGSFENVKKHAANMTIEAYSLFNAKLSQAKGELSKEEYTEFKKMLKVITSSKLEYGDQYGNIDYDQVPQKEMNKIRKALMEVQPFFDKLNGQKSSKDILTGKEYKTYIESLITYETITAKSGINPSEGLELEQIQPDLLDEFLKAREFMNYVDEKQMQ